MVNPTFPHERRRIGIFEPIHWMARGLAAEIDSSPGLRVAWTCQDPNQLPVLLERSPADLLVARWSTAGPSCLRLDFLSAPPPACPLPRIALVPPGDPDAMRLASLARIEACLWLDKSDPILRIIHHVLAGGRFHQGSGLPWHRLTTAERRIVRAVVDAPHAKLAAIDLDPPLSLRTIESHLHHVYRKLGIPGRQSLLEAYRLELTTMDPLAGRPGRVLPTDACGQNRR